jgi:hypothetical protein
MIVSNHQGLIVACLIHPSLLDSMLNQIQAESPEDMLVVQEFAKVFTYELPSMPPE